MAVDHEAQVDGETSPPSSPQKQPSSALKKIPSYASYLEIFGSDADPIVLLKTYRFHRPGPHVCSSPMFSQDDCLNLPSSKTQTPHSVKCRLSNAAWRLWTQRTYKLEKFDAKLVPHKLPSPWTKRKVCFNEQVDKLILPPLPDPYQLEDEDFEYDEEPGLVDNLGSVCFNILLTVSSFLSPYYSLSSKKFSTWLM